MIYIAALVIVAAIASAVFLVPQFIKDSREANENERT